MVSPTSLVARECARVVDTLIAQIPVFPLDAWAGVSSFSEAWDSCDLVSVAEHAWVEYDSIAVRVLTEFVPTTTHCLDFYSERWKPWKFNFPLVVTGGPSCCPFSISGKRMRDRDSRSTQGMDTAVLACLLGAAVLIIENVSDLVTGDKVHHIMSDMIAFMLSKRRAIAGIWDFLHSDVGGCTNRRRVFPV